SPDGEIVAFVSNRDGNNHIWLMAKDGTNQRPFTRGSPNKESAPHFLRDGTLAYLVEQKEGGRTTSQVVKADLTTGKVAPLRATGGLDQLQQSDVPDPPGAGALGLRHVRVAPRAAALNHLDLFVVRGLPHEYRFPHIVGADGAGVVDAVGAEVRSVRPGDRVMINPGIPDYSCEYCRAGEQSLCRRYGILG